MRSGDDPFVDEEGQPRVLLGASIISGSTRIAELAGLLGFDVVWIEMEHGPAGFMEVEALCVSAQAGGALPAVRLPDASRNNILRAVEVGARIVIVPMVNDAETAREIARHGKYPPLGQRGYNTRSRGLIYGIESPPESFVRANRRTHFIAQIETLEAAARVEEICAVEGLSGVLIGPGDLSVSAGKTGALADPELIERVTEIVRRSRAAGKHCGILVAQGPMLDAALEAGCDLIFCASDLGDLTGSWRNVLLSIARR